MKLLTFLGVGNYSETVYAWQDRACKTRFAPVASHAFLNPDEIIVFLTEDAKEKIYEELKAAFPAEVNIRDVAIPLGKDENELWEIFDRVGKAVQPGEEVAFDITHGLRHFPMVGLLAAAFLRSGLDVSIRAVLYGAFDVGRVVSPGATPMYDLTPMLTLLEWSSAADRFNRTGDARYLASLVGDQRKAMAVAAQRDPELLNQVGKVGNLAGALTSISQNLRLVRPVGAMQQTVGFSARLEEARPGLNHTPLTRPFVMLLDRVEATFAPLGLEDALAESQAFAFLAQQRAMIHWYHERELWVQMVTLAREWLVNWFMAYLGSFDWQNNEERGRVENIINTESKELISARMEEKQFCTQSLDQVPVLEEALEIWMTLANVRNDINHAGFRKGPKDADTLVKALQQLAVQLNDLPLEEPQA